jgi:transcriptional regulator with XRE-family HTH domain/tetratricopeptide (TPR) repeat protein
MAKRRRRAAGGDPRASRMLVINLRAVTDKTQMEFGKACRVDQGQLSQYEMGKSVPSEDVLRRMAAAARLRWPVVLRLRRALAAVLAEVGEPGQAGAAPAAPALDRQVERILSAVTPYLIEDAGLESRRPTPEEARRAADEIVTRLSALPVAGWRALVELTARASRSWALAERLCDESVCRAAHDAAQAREVAELALSVAERVPGTESWRSAVQAYAWAVLGSARRVGTDFDSADEAHSKARQLWEASSDEDRARLAGWRMLDLEASLRREQHRFTESLSLLGEARALAEPDDLAVARILLKQEHVHERKGDFDAALATLAEAAPRIAASGDPRLSFLLRHKTVINLCHLERYAEAEALLPEVQKTATRQGKDLDSLRVLWVAARVDLGQGRRDQAERKLEQVRAEFTSRRLAYDAALASLELAVLWLESGRTAEVRELSLGMAWIFDAQKIRREALAALRLFTEAARREAATVELARQVIAELKREGLSPSPGPTPRVRPAGPRRQ